MSASTEPPAPRDLTNFGRMVTHGHMARGWACRWCGRALVYVGAAVVCLGCDRNPTVPV